MGPPVLAGRVAGDTEQFWMQLRPKMLFGPGACSCENLLEFKDRERDGGAVSTGDSFKPLSLHVFTQGHALKKCKAFEAHHFN